MHMNTYDEKIVRYLNNDLGNLNFRLIYNSDYLFSELMTYYPVLGSKIDWSKVEGAIEEKLPSDGVDFFNRMKERFSLEGIATYVGDGVTEIAVESCVDCMAKILSGVIDIPQHHYVIGRNYSWCICITMEGDVDFGFSGK